MSSIVPLVSHRHPHPYAVRDGGFYVSMGPQRYNRALYGVPVHGSRFSVFAGDIPEWMLYQAGGAGYVFLGLAQGEDFVPLSAFAHYDLWYGGGKAVSTAADPAHGRVRVETLTAADSPALLLRVEAHALAPDARLCVVYGGIDRAGDERNLDAGYTPQEKTLFRIGCCEGNRAEADGASVRVTGGDIQATVETDCPCQAMAIQAAAFQAGRLMPAQTGDALATLILEGHDGAVLIRVALAAGEADLRASWDKAVRRQEALAARMGCTSSDPALDASVRCLPAAMEGMWLAPYYLHGAWSWRIPLLGWRSRFGPTALGWGDRVREEARAYFAMMYRDGGEITRQQTTAFDQAYFSHHFKGEGLRVREKTAPGAPDPSYRFARQAPESVFNSDGAIPYGPSKQGIVQYDMQEDFITQVIYQLNAEQDERFAREVFPCLKRHLAWQDRCFDADGDHLYENFANYWASDSMQYSGAGCALATANNYHAYAAAAQLALLLHEDPQPYLDKLAAIRSAFHEQLWMREEKHPAECRDALGQRLLHPQAILPTIVTCITSGILTDEECLSSLDYVRNELEHVPLADGELVYNSQCAPYRWSVRDVDHADVCHLALCCFLMNRAEDGWKYLRGVIGESCMRSVAPGAFMCVLEGKSVDFSDTTSMFARAVVEGLYGYRPHLLAGYVELAPAIPAALPELTWHIPAAQGRWVRREGSLRYSFALATPAERLVVRLPLHQEEVQAVRVNGEATAAYQLVRKAGFPCAEVHLTHVQSAEIELCLSGAASVCSIGRIPPKPRAQECTPQPRPFAQWRTLDLDDGLCHRISDLFSSPYLSPRPTSCSLQVPWSLLPASWCIGAKGEALDAPFGFTLTDEPLRSAVKDGVFTACGIPFRQHGAADVPNVLFVSQWDRFPTSAQIKLNAPAGQFALLITGYTNHMQCGVVNARLRFLHADGTETCRELLAPVDFRSIESGPENERPEDRSCYRKELPRAVIGRFSGSIAGNAYAQVSLYEMEKPVTMLQVEAVANEVVFGLMGVSVAAQKEGAD